MSLSPDEKFHPIKTKILKLSTVEPLNSRHHWFSKKVSTTERCPLKRGKFQWKVRNWFQKMMSTIERCPLWRMSAIERLHCTSKPTGYLILRLHVVQTFCITTRTGHDRGSVYTGPLGSETVWIRTADPSGNNSHSIHQDPKRCTSVTIGKSSPVNTKHGTKQFLYI